MTPTQEKFAAELEPLLHATERAVLSGDRPAARELSISMLETVGKYSELLSRDEIREVLNAPTAAAIAKRLGVQP